MEPAFGARRASRRCALLLALVLPAAAAHDPPGQPPDPAHYTEEIQVTGHYENSVGTSDAASAGRITSQLVEDRPILRPGEVLELVPGLIVTQHSGAGKANQYFLRGFNLDHGTDFLTTLDGMPLNLRTHAHGQGYTDLNFVIPELIHRVDYFKGPYFASKGDFASAGAADIHYAESIPKNLVELAGGSSLYGRALVAGSPGLAGGKLLYGLELAHEDGPWERPDDYRRVNGVLRYTHPSTDAKWGLTAMGYYGIWNSTDQIPQRAVDSGQIDRFGAVDPTTGGKSWRFSLSGDYQQALGNGVLQANLYGVRYRLNLFSDFTYFLHDPVNGDQFEQADDRWMFGTSGDYTWTGTLAAMSLRATAGWEGRHDRIDPVGLYATAARGRLATVRQDSVRETSGGVFAEGELAIARWMRAVLGVRYDHFFFDVGSDNPLNSGKDAAGRVSPKIAAILGPWAKTELFLDFGLGFHSNDARGVTTTVDPGSGQAVQKVTPLVQTRGGELGIRTEILPDVQSSLALWRLDVDSELLFTGDAGTTEPSRASRRYGIEWNSQWHPTRWLVFDLVVAWSHARFTTRDPDPAVAGDHIPGSIEWASSGAVTLHELGPWRASLDMRYFGPRPLTEDDSPRSTASTLFSAQASLQATKWARLSVEVFNIFDAQVDDIAYFYASRLRGEPPVGVPPAGVAPRCGPASRTPCDVHFHPAEPRSLRLGAAFTF